MVARYMPTEDELYLYALLTDASGVDFAEFAWTDDTPGKTDRSFRVWDFQWPWYRDPSMYQADQASRTLGKSEGIAMRACVHPFCFPGQERLITAPELNHLRPIMDNIEKRIRQVWFLREMCPKDRHMGISRQPHWQMRFLNGAEIRSRLPQRDGKGVKGQHPVIIELDEAQDYPDPGYTEIIECLKEVPGAQWRLHGVPKGLRDRFWKFTTGQDPALPFTVHRKMAMERPTWNDLERRRKIALYEGSRLNPDYRRNMYGEHGDATSPLFVLARLMACVDADEGSEYNTEVYARVVIMEEELEALREHPKDTSAIIQLLEERVPGIHRVGYSMYFGGGDVGVTNHPSEFLIFGQPEKKDTLRLLLRLHMERVSIEEQQAALLWLREHYHRKLRFGIDRAGVGFGLWQPLADSKVEKGLITPHAGVTDPWLIGLDFSEKLVVALDETRSEDPDEQLVERFTIDYSSEELRHAVDAKRPILPLDNDLLNQFQGQTTSAVKGGDVDPNRPKKRYSTGTFHALDGAKYMIAAKMLWPLHKRILAGRAAPSAPVYAVFPGATF